MPAFLPAFLPYRGHFCRHFLKSEGISKLRAFLVLAIGTVIPSQVELRNAHSFLPSGKVSAFSEMPAFLMAFPEMPAFLPAFSRNAGIYAGISDGISGNAGIFALCRAE